MNNATAAHPIRVLIIDDNEIVTAQLRGLRVGSGSLITSSAASLEAGLRQISQGEPDMVCLDIEIPGIDGMSVIQTIKAQYPHIHVVAFSSDTRRSTIIQALSSGAIGYVVKPFSEAQVLAVIEPLATLHRNQPSEPSNGASVLVVDQNPEMRALLTHMLLTLKFNVVAEAETGMEGLIQLEKVRPAVICLSIDTPEVNGLDAVTAVKAVHPEVAVVFVTAHAERELVQLAVDRGANGYILKPITLANVQAGLRQALRSFRAGQHASGRPNNTPEV